METGGGRGLKPFEGILSHMVPWERKARIETYPTVGTHAGLWLCWYTVGMPREALREHPTPVAIHMDILVLRFLLGR